MVCAKELNIPQISEYMKHMGITDEELEALKQGLKEDVTEFVDQVAAEMEENEEESENDLSNE